MEPENHEDAEKDPPPPPPPPTSSSSSPNLFGFSSGGSSLFGVTTDAFPSWSSTPLVPTSAPSLLFGSNSLFSPSHNTRSRDGDLTFFPASTSFPSTSQLSPSGGIFSNLDLNRGTRNRRFDAVRECQNAVSFLVHISATTSFLDSQPEMLRAADYKKGDRRGSGFRPAIPSLGESSQTSTFFGIPNTTLPTFTAPAPSPYSSGFTFGGGNRFATQNTSRAVPGQGLTSQSLFGQHFQNIPGIERLPTLAFEHVENMIINIHMGNTPSSQQQGTRTEDVSEPSPPSRGDAQRPASTSEPSEPAFTLGQSRPSVERSSSDISPSRRQQSPNASKSPPTAQQKEQQQ